MAAHSPLNLPLTRWLLGRRRSTSQRGFTLTELLVSLVMGTLIMGSLLYLVVELLGMNAREERLTQVQQDTRRALDYMSREVREAVFVYANPTVATAQLTDVGDLGTPVMAFWRLRDIEDRIGALNADCSTYGTPANRDLCGVLKLRRSAYHLVVYFVEENAGTIWSGPNRIIRYELPAYKDLATLELVEGYRDPTLPDPDPTKPPPSFATWTREGATTKGNPAVLTDSIAVFEALGGTTFCSRDPLQLSEQQKLVCTRFSFAGIADDRTVYLFLRGSIAQSDGSSGVTLGPVGAGSALPTLSTEVQVRGVLERTRTD